MNAAARRNSLHGFTLIELLVVIAIIAVLASILFPVFARAREKARQAACLSNTKQLGLGIAQYIQDFDEMLPRGGFRQGSIGSRWFRDVYPYVKSVDVFVCPSKNEGTGAGWSDWTPRLTNVGWGGMITAGPTSPGSYGINANLVGYPWTSANNPPPPAVDSRTLADITDSAGTFLACETAEYTTAIVGNSDTATWPNLERVGTDWQVTPPTSWTGTEANRYTTSDANWLRRPAARHSGGLNVIYSDGHAKWSKMEQFLGVTTARPAGWPYGDRNNSWDNK